MIKNPSLEYHIVPCNCLLFRRLKNFLQEDIVKNLVENATAINNSEEEFEQLKTDREILRQIFPTGENRVIPFICIMLISLLLEKAGRC